MNLFLYSHFIKTPEGQKNYIDFAIFSGRHLDKRKNLRFRMENVLFSLSGGLESGEILVLPDRLMADRTHEVEEIEKLSEIFHKIIFMVFNDRRRKKKS